MAGIGPSGGRLAAWGYPIPCFLFPPTPASLVSSALFKPEPQSTPGLQGLPGGEYERPAWLGAAPLGPLIVLG